MLLRQLLMLTTTEDQQGREEVFFCFLLFANCNYVIINVGCNCNVMRNVVDDVPGEDCCCCCCCLGY